MAKDPICPIYYNDLLGSTRDWTDEEFGCYVRLLLEQWDKGKIPNPHQNSTKNLPNDYQRLTRISTSVERNWELISTKFSEVDGGLANEVMEDIRTKRLKFKEKQSENRRKGYQNSTKPSTKTLPRLENENEINNLWFLKYYHSNYEVYKKTFNGQSTSEHYFNQWKKFIDFIYENKYESVFDCKFVSPHSFEILVTKEKFTEERWDETIKKILSTGVKAEHDLFFRIPEFMKYVKKENDGTHKQSVKHSPKSAGQYELIDRLKGKVNPGGK